MEKDAKPKTPRVFSPTSQKRRAKALQDKKSRIMQAALDLFAQNGVTGTSIEQIAERADVSKSNLLYYFNSKEQVYFDVVNHLLSTWLTPLQQFSVEQDPIATLSNYIRVKLEQSRDNPAESKLFCMEVVQGAPHLINELQKPLKDLVLAKTAVIDSWIAQGKLKPVDPYHLIFSIWAITQHYADFNVQIKAVTGKDLNNPKFFKEALEHIQRIVLDGVRP